MAGGSLSTIALREGGRGRLQAASQGKAKPGGGVVPVRAARAVSPQRTQRDTEKTERLV